MTQRPLRRTWIETTKVLVIKVQHIKTQRPLRRTWIETRLEDHNVTQARLTQRPLRRTWIETEDYVDLPCKLHDTTSSSEDVD